MAVVLPSDRRKRPALTSLLCISFFTVLAYQCVRVSPAWVNLIESAGHLQPTRRYAPPRSPTHGARRNKPPPAVHPGCASGERVFSDTGESCVADLQKALKSQLIFYSNGTRGGRYLFCAIPKNGCTVHLGLMYRIAGDRGYGSAPGVHNGDKKKVYNLSARSHEEIVGLLQDRSLSKYAVVRNPMARTLSAYLDKVERHVVSDERTVENFHKWVMNEFPLAATATKGVNPHWKPQINYCGFKVKDVHKYFKVFRAEEPKEYVDFLYGIVSRRNLDDGWEGDRNVSFREGVLGPRERTVKADELITTYYSNVTVFDHLAEWLSEDIGRLGYTEAVAQMRMDIVRQRGKRLFL